MPYLTRSPALPEGRDIFRKGQDYFEKLCFRCMLSCEDMCKGEHLIPSANQDTFRRVPGGANANLAGQWHTVNTPKKTGPQGFLERSQLSSVPC